MGKDQCNKKFEAKHPEKMAIVKKCRSYRLIEEATKYTKKNKIKQTCLKEWQDK